MTTAVVTVGLKLMTYAIELPLVGVLTATYLGKKFFAGFVAKPVADAVRDSAIGTLMSLDTIVSRGLEVITTPTLIETIVEGAIERTVYFVVFSGAEAVYGAVQRVGGMKVLQSLHSPDEPIAE
mmetsp:Transcript_15089/g.29677  ORF Transcript_15089/g.29677 Transcript_15089/m.29677 type:complete len:124 (-) Transcript_15089:88-459(-)|eukprot:CAMPEP_0175097470 /NCGR_PEP_ID=MMETSP0086_2-20121207/5303_1 /TAXON_ID=136419 /ORGANISM="Unknown Unknown, Strain D1" /LENGTH=123 /DNA_ID=CAMNT_0016370981 /DNA_START=39 /DNA_END=410 /DNA_ORIENTATION=+